MSHNGKIRVLTWHVHGNYLYYLTQSNCIFYLPQKYSYEEGYSGRTHDFSWGENVFSVPIDMVKHIKLDCILFQSKRNYTIDQYEILSTAQRSLPKIYLEHAPPKEHPTDNDHIVDDPNIVVVHVTHFNNLMWNCNSTPTVVIEHGIYQDPHISYTGKIHKGITVLNNLTERERQLGIDIFEIANKKIPLDIIGKGTEKIGGLGEVRHSELSSFITRYRFYFHPVRYDSLSLSVCEAMMAGMPIVGLATSELPTIIENDISGYIHTNIHWLIHKMDDLLDQPLKARRLGEIARETAVSRFQLERFRDDWERLFKQVIQQKETIASET